MRRHALRIITITLCILAMAAADLLAGGPTQGQQPADEWTGRGRGYDMGAMRYGDGPREGNGPWVMTAEQIDELLDVLAEVNPEVAQRIEQHRADQPDSVMQMLRPHAPGLQRLVYLKRNEPEHYALRVEDIQLERHCDELAGELRNAEAADDAETAGQLRTELAAAVARHFDVRQQLRERHLQRLEQRIEELRQQIEQRRAARDELIQQRIDELVSDAAQAQW